MKLSAAAREDFHGDAETVRVVLGTADPGELHWGTSSGVYYAIEWDGVCTFPAGGFIAGPSPTEPSPAGTPQAGSCQPGRWATVIDARSGHFIVGGN